MGKKKVPELNPQAIVNFGGLSLVSHKTSADEGRVHSLLALLVQEYPTIYVSAYECF
jgi:hypothetical protein